MTTDDGSYRVDIHLDHLDPVTARVSGLLGFAQASFSGLITAAHQQWSGAASQRHQDAHRESMPTASEVEDGIARRLS
ncbi:hypothetical protein [Nocardia sp. SC052]|uniref:hypothetical protein n=1 Tax=Nocardia sichangensis TaxID=3385975 RepID=UPI0039A268DC